MNEIHTNRTPALPDSTMLAVDRTRLAHDRTLMAWVRTATSLISFGFTIYKFFQDLPGSKDVTHPNRLLSSRNFALIMITTGLVSLALATWQHRQSMNDLHRHYGVPRRSLTELLAAMIAVLGGVGLAAVFFRQ